MGSDNPLTPGAPLNDPRSLEQYFRSHFTELATEAKAQLDDASSAAPRVVEGAFRHAWEERERILTPQDLDSFLHEELRHGVAREKSRRASLHRHDASGGSKATATHAPPALDVEQSWNHLSHQLHLVPDDARTVAAQEVAAHLRHDTAGHVADMAKTRSWKAPVAVGVLAAIVVAGGIYYVDRLGDEGAVTGALAAPDARVHVASNQQMAIVGLDDGTKVTLAPESKLIVPKRFGDQMRAVKLDGEAAFTVPPRKSAPFEIRAGSASIVVTGTVLMVRAFASESAVVIALKEGTANVKVGDSTRAVKTGDALFVKKNVMREATAPELQEATTWNDKTLTISNRQLRDVLPQLKRWYGLDIKVVDLPLLDRSVSLQSSLDSQMEAIKGVESSANVKFGWEGKTMVFRDATAPAKKK